MFKKLLKTIISNPIWVVFGLLCFALFFSIKMSSTDVKQNVEIVQEPYYLEIHYGNGDVYTVEVKSVTVGINYVPCARLHNDYLYRFTDTYNYVWDDEFNTYILYLWRDEPYELEKQLFTKVAE